MTVCFWFGWTLQSLSNDSNELIMGGSFIQPMRALYVCTYCVPVNVPLSFILRLMEALTVSVTASRPAVRRLVKMCGVAAFLTGILAGPPGFTYVNHLACPENRCWSLIPQSGCLARTSLRFAALHLKVLGSCMITSLSQTQFLGVTWGEIFTGSFVLIPRCRFISGQTIDLWTRRLN